MGASNAAGRSDKPTGPPRILFQESRRPPADDAVRKLRSEVTGDVFSCVTCFRNRYGDQPKHSDVVDKCPSPAQITSFCELSHHGSNCMCEASVAECSPKFHSVEVSYGTTPF